MSKIFIILLFIFLADRVAPESIASDYVSAKLHSEITTEVITMKITYQADQKINNLVFLKEVEPHIQPSGQKARKALFRCYCGNEFEAHIASVKCGKTQSCGCYHIQKATTHGLTNHPLYRVWTDMKARCYNPKNKRFHRYGGRGIKACDEWRNDFKKFYDFCIQNGWKKGLQIDRINNDGNYEPGNCRFVTNAENQKNKSNKTWRI